MTERTDSLRSSTVAISVIQVIRMIYTRIYTRWPGVCFQFGLQRLGRYNPRDYNPRDYIVAVTI